MNLPNKLTVLRLIMVPVIIVVMLLPLPTIASGLLAAAIFGLTALLCDIGCSFEILGAHNLKKICNEFKMIVVPELYAGLEEDTVKLLLDYAKNGGKLLLCGKNTCRIFAKAGAPFEAQELPENFPKGILAYDNGFVDDKPHIKTYYFILDSNRYECGSLF